MLLAAILAMVLVVAVPAVAQVANTGDTHNSLGIIGSPGDDSAGITGGSDTSKDACHDEIVDRLASELEITMEEAEELLDLVREFADAEEFDALVEEFCDQ
jgi:hypothetical protein